MGNDVAKSKASAPEDESVSVADVGTDKKKNKQTLSEFRKKKLISVFRQYFDMNGNGSLDREDFDLARKTVCRLNLWKPDSEAWTAAEETFENLWRLLCECGDKNRDGKITVDEWLKMWEKASVKISIRQLYKEWEPKDAGDPDADSEATPKPHKSFFNLSSSSSSSPLKSLPWMEKFIEYKFNLFDRTRNGFIDEEEFEFVSSYFGVPSRDAKKAFLLMTQNGEIEMNFLYFKRLLLEFYFSDDEGSLGNFVTGKLQFDEEV